MKYILQVEKFCLLAITCVIKRDEVNYVGQGNSVRYYAYTILTYSLFIFTKSITICVIKQVIIFTNISYNYINNRPNNHNNSYNIYDNKNDDNIKLKVIYLMNEFQFIIIKRML